MDKFSRYRKNGEVTMNANSRLGWHKIEPILPKDTDTLYKIQVGDTILSVAQRFYSNQKLWWLIALRNNIIDPTTEVSPGDVLYIPEVTL